MSVNCKKKEKKKKAYVRVSHCLKWTVLLWRECRAEIKKIRFIVRWWCVFVSNGAVIMVGPSRTRVICWSLNFLGFALFSGCDECHYKIYCWGVHHNHICCSSTGGLRWSSPKLIHTMCSCVTIWLLSLRLSKVKRRLWPLYSKSAKKVWTYQSRFGDANTFFEVSVGLPIRVHRYLFFCSALLRFFPVELLLEELWVVVV